MAAQTTPIWELQGLNSTTVTSQSHAQMSVFWSELEEHENSGIGNTDTDRQHSFTTVGYIFTSTRLTRRLSWFSPERAASNGNGEDQPQCLVRSANASFPFTFSSHCNYVKYFQITVYYIMCVSQFSETHTNRNEHHKGNERYADPDDVTPWASQAKNLGFREGVSGVPTDENA